MKDVFETIAMVALGIVGCVLGLAVMAAMFALPFVGIGLGISASVWLSCLALPFC